MGTLDAADRAVELRLQGSSIHSEAKEIVMKVLHTEAIVHWTKSMLGRDPNKFLRDVSGVVHVGANIGQERELYDKFGLRVIWIEPIPEVFDMLKRNLSDFPNQRAIQCLITDRDDEEYEFHIASNAGASSSILDLEQHKDVWPTITYTSTISIRSMTLASLFQRENIKPSEYQALVIDTQGSELLVLEGSVPLLDGFRYIKTEVPNFESYAGCCQLADVRSFMARHGYREFSRSRFAWQPGVGSYFDIVYRRQS